MTLKRQLLEWLQADEDRLTELTAQEVAEDFEYQLNRAKISWDADFIGGERADELMSLVTEIRLEMVMMNMKTIPDLSFQASQKIYPFPTSQEVHQAKIILDPSYIPSGMQF